MAHCKSQNVLLILMLLTIITCMFGVYHILNIENKVSKKVGVQIYTSLTYSYEQILSDGCLIRKGIKCRKAALLIINEDLSNTLRWERNTMGVPCQVPRLDPFSREIMKRLNPVDPIKCEGQDWIKCYLQNGSGLKSHTTKTMTFAMTAVLPVSDIIVLTLKIIKYTTITINKKYFRKLSSLRNDIYLNDGAKKANKCFIPQYILTNYKEVRCTIKDLIRRTDHYNIFGDAYTIRGGENYTLNASDYIHAKCTSQDNNKWRGFAAGLRHIPKSSINHEKKSKQYSIVMFIFDSTSKNAFIRHMKSSYKYMKKHMDAIVMNDYNIVGDGTPANLIPILTGMTELELPEARKSAINSTYVDRFPFIWRLLKKYGYTTAYHEDSPSIGTFQLRMNGFNKQPTDHYLRTLHVEARKEKKYGTGFCLGATPRHIMLMDQTKQFLEINQNRPSFMLSFHGEVSHRKLEGLEAVDKDFVVFLKSIKSEGLLNDTVLLVMADHGPRFEGFRKTYHGKIEERLPFISFILPESFKSERPEAVTNLKLNSEILTSCFDMHSTILDVVGLMDYKSKIRISGADGDRSLSMLGTIPWNRTCSEAGIAAHWCSCITWVPLINKTLQNVMVETFTNLVNELTRTERQLCSYRHPILLEKITQGYPSLRMLQYQDKKDFDAYFGKYKPVVSRNMYQIRLVMDPANATYEALFTHDLKESILNINPTDISRIDRYGEQADCIIERRPDIAKFCFCKNSKV